MSIYSISCTIYSSYIQSLNQYFGKESSSARLIDSFADHLGIKRVYIGSQLIYSCGMFLMGYFRHRVAVILLSAVSGILYSTLFTMPYLLISQYYASNTVSGSNCAATFFRPTNFLLVRRSESERTSSRDRHRCGHRQQYGFLGSTVSLVNHGHLDLSDQLDSHRHCRCQYFGHLRGHFSDTGVVFRLILDS